MSDLRTKVIDAMLTDDGYTQKEYSRLLSIYSNANDISKGLIDEIFINLTGFSLKTLLKIDEDDDE
jgi:hypothetical protein